MLSAAANAVAAAVVGNEATAVPLEPPAGNEPPSDPPGDNESPRARVARPLPTRESATKTGRLSFAKDDAKFSVMGDIYLKRELWKKIQGQTVIRWEEAMADFMKICADMAESLQDKNVRSFQQSFQGALESRLKSLPEKPVDGGTEPEHYAVCRKILDARGDMEVTVLPPPGGAAAKEKAPKKRTRRLRFATDDEMFLVMARIYLERKLYHKIRFQTMSRWQEAEDEFYEDHAMSEKHGRREDGVDDTKAFKASFESAIDKRLKDLPDPLPNGQEEPELIKVCREILKIHEEIQAASNDDNSSKRGTRKRRSGEQGDQATEDEGSEGNPKKKLARAPPFTKSDEVFCTFARIYLRDELYTKVFGQTVPRWEAAMQEFFENDSIADQLEPIKTDNGSFRHTFVKAVDYRAKRLPLEPKEGEEEPEAERLCREILAARGEMIFEQVPGGAESHEGEDDNAQDGNDDGAVQSPAKKRRRKGSVRRKIVPLDLNLTTDMMNRIQAVQEDRAAEQQAAADLARAEALLEEAKKRVDEARTRKQTAANQAEQNSLQICEVLLNESGPWNDMYNKLVAYKEEHGSFIVRGSAPEVKELRNWAQRQRDRNALNAGHTQKLPWYLVRNLDAIGFPWKIHEDAWWTQYKALVDYKAEHGDCMVPRGYKPNPSLAHWVKRMRYEAKKYQEDPTSVPTTAEQIKLLNDIGFVWENPNTLSWNQRWSELLRFKEEHGHCNVPKSYPANPKLVSWCQNQRASRNAFLAGKKTFITAERIQMLEDVGFEFTSKNYHGRGGRRRNRRNNAHHEDDSDSDEDEPENDGPGAYHPANDSYRTGHHNVPAVAGYHAPLEYRDTNNYQRFHLM